ncbi:hypothetical protein BT63DRAFT_405336 [Microthyrium microscopicum]|uniref:G-protein coupled receptors family 2 profile 2 domain-containing protein n=1 Tax=Microthyrium microscopicum TaxID=703497 RepID=A0A6A6U349_9PEZI|nr:hypothetical protein BT63DRAFT_405336 [Microthyrium microscopicum]
MAINMTCPAPFLNPEHFTSGVGYIAGRFCGTEGASGPTCCLPCPLSQWVFDANFMRIEKKLQDASPASLFACLFLLISWILVPSKYSHRHYLSIGLVICVTFIALALAIPMVHEPKQCADAITPSDFRSDLTCAWTGSLFLLGGLGVVVWVFLRVIWLHICVCWDRTPGKTFITMSVATGIAVPLIFLGATFGTSGFSYSLGQTCFINTEHSFALFWAWLIGLSCVSLLVQLVTTGYCVVVFIKSHRMRENSNMSTATGSSWGSIKRLGQRKRSEEAEKAADERTLLQSQRRDRWRGIRQILVLQWRIILLAVALVVEGLYFSSLSWASQNKGNSASKDPRGVAFGACLVLNAGNATKCQPQAEYLVVSKSATLAALGVMSLSGVQALLLLTHFSLFKGWYEIIRHPRLILPTNRRRHSSHASLTPTNAGGLLASTGPTLRAPNFHASSASRPKVPPPIPLRSPLRTTTSAEPEISLPIPLPEEYAFLADTPAFSSLSSRYSQVTSASDPSKSSGAPARPARPQTLNFEIDPADGEDDAPMPAHITDSGIAYPEQLPAWVRTMPGSGPVVDLRGPARGGLGLHPVDGDDGPRSPKIAKGGGEGNSK